MKLLQLPLAGLAATLALAVAAQGADFTVTNTEDSGPGSLRQLLGEASLSPGADTITFIARIAGETIALLSEISITDADGVTVDASVLHGGVTVGVGGSHRHFFVSATASLTLTGLTLSGGKVPEGSGGSIHNSGNLTLNRCTLTGNSALDGGAVFNNRVLALNDCTLTGNTAGIQGNGGAVADNEGTLTITGSTFAANSAKFGGAICLNNDEGRLTLVHCTFHANTAEHGGAIYGDDGLLTLTHCTIVGNSANSEGGGIALGRLWLTNSIVSGNRAPAGHGGDIFNNGFGSITRAGANLIQSIKAVAGTESGPPALTDDPSLSPLGSYGGSTQTMPPYAGSPAIDAVPADSAIPGLSADQRGFGRTQDGDRSGAALADIGAAERPGTQVTTILDEFDTPSGPQVSLREALRDAPPGDGVVFAFAGLWAPTTGLDEAKGEIVLTKDVVIDGTRYDGGITLDGGPGTNRIFSVSATRNVTLVGLKLTGGNGRGAASNGFGGAIYNEGELSLIRCTLADNTAFAAGLFSGGGAVGNDGVLRLVDCMLANNSSTEGGAIESTKSVLLQRCTLAGNSALHSGGAIVSLGTLELENSTLTGNTAQLGGAIFAETTLRLTHCTVTDNHTHPGSGAISVDDADVTLTNCIVALNTPSGLGADLYVDEESSGTIITRAGANIIPRYLSRAGSTEIGPPALTADPRLAPLGNYGGITPTMPPLSRGSAIDAVPVASPPAGPSIDQRGYSRPVDADGDGIAAADCGAVESVLSWVTTSVDEFDTPSGPSVSLREAIRDVQDHRIIAFSPALFVPSAPHIMLDPSNGELRVDKNLIIDGHGPDKSVTVHGGPGTNRVFFIPDEGNVTLAKLTLTGGNASGAGFNGWGGAIYNTGRLTLTDCTLTGNANASGIGGAIYSDGTLVLTRCLLTGNSSSASGGALFDEGIAVLMACTLSSNHAGTGGGAIKTNSNISLYGCALYGNSATSDGGAIYDEEGAVELKNCTLSGNSAGGTGSAIYAEDTILSLTHCTVSGHSRGAIAGHRAELTLRNSIVSGSSPPASLLLPYPDIVGFSSVRFTGANLVQSPVEAGVISGPPPISAAALLAPLGDYGGPTWTSPPLVSSPAVDAVPMGSEVAGLPTDQRGIGRILAVNGDFAARADLGAVELVVNWVTIALDKLAPPSSSISLREALRDAPDHATIAFRPGIFSPAMPSITLDPTLGEIVLSRNVTIDASKTVGGVTIDGGPGNHRLFYTLAGQRVLFTGLRLTGGESPTDGGAIYADHFSSVTLVDCTLTGHSAESSGGAIKSEGTLMLERCILSGNTAGTIGGAVVNDGTSTMIGCTLTGNTTGLSGGALYAEGPLTLTQCLISGNSAIEGGAITCDAGGALSMAHCTLTGNSARTGGGIFTEGSFPILRLTHCTLASNAASVSGGAIHWEDGELTLINCIVAMNTAPDGSGKDIYAAGGEVIRTGANIIQSFANAGATETGPAALPADPLLAPLGDHGGSTYTMALRAGSPALDATEDSTAVSDQRGFPIIGRADLGAYEAGTPTNFQTWSLETTGGSLDFVADLDGDGAPNGLEYALRRHPLTAEVSGLGAPLPASLGVGLPPALVLAFPWQPAATDLRYILQRSSDLTIADGWTAALTLTPPTSFTHGTGVIMSLTELDGGTVYIYDTNLGAPVAFWRLVVQRVP